MSGMSGEEKMFCTLGLAGFSPDETKQILEKVMQVSSLTSDAIVKLMGDQGCVKYLEHIGIPYKDARDAATGWIDGCIIGELINSLVCCSIKATNRIRTPGLVESMLESRAQPR